MRRDAAERRDALIKAAAECFQESGYLVPLEEVARRAGVGRGTLYRNFADRFDLAVAVFQAEVERIEAAVSPATDPREAVFAAIALGADSSALYSRLANDLPRDGGRRPAMEALHRRTLDFWRPLLEGAQACGFLRRDLDPDDLIRVTRMIGALVSPMQTEAEIREEIDKALALLTDGMRAR